MTPASVAVSHSIAALRPKILADKMQGAGRGHAVVKPCNDVRHYFGPQPDGRGPIFSEYGVAARSRGTATLRLLRRVLQKNDRRRGGA